MSPLDARVRIVLAVALTARAVSSAADCFMDETGASSGTTPDCNGNSNPDPCDVAAVSFGLVSDARYPTGGSSAEPAIADLDGDGDLDIAVQESSVQLYENNGEGRFLRPLYPLRRPPGIHALEPADVDGDGDIDLITSAALDGTVTVVENEGSWRFTGNPATGTSLPPPISVATGDFDLDGDVDIAVAHASTETLRFSTNENGAGFILAASVPMEGPSAISVGDLNGDGRLDVAVGRTGAVEIVLNDGNWSFRVEAGFAIPSRILSIALGDLDGDGDLDVAAGGERSIWTSKNRGEGLFGPASSSPSLGRPASIFAADLDGDGDLDLAAADDRTVFDPPASTLPLRVLLNDGTGSFDQPREYEPARNIAPGDVDGDGDLDVIGFSPSGPLLILRNRPVALSKDCDLNGIPDECEPSPADCEDCDRNGVADARDIALGAQRDDNGNGIPDSCELPSFELRFRAPEAVDASAMAFVRFPATVELRASGIGPDEPGASAWLVMARVEAGEFVDITTEGTAAAPPPQGFFVRGFSRNVVNAESGCEATALSVVVLSIEEPISLPGGGPHDLVRLTVETAPRVEGPHEVGLLFIDKCPDFRGAGLGGHEIDSAVIYFDWSFLPAHRDAVVKVGSARFRRADVNGDGRADISDAIRTFMFLFAGALDPPCLDTADTNDDGHVNMTDGIHLLNDFFREGTGIPDPGPFDCGFDPSADDLSCLSYSRCQ